MNYTIRMDAANGSVEATVHAVCDPRTIDEYEKTLLSFADKARREVGHLRLLVDSAQVGPLPAESVARLMVLEDRLVKPGDRIAVVVASSIAKAQLATPSRHEQVKCFVSTNAARIWLTAHDAGGALAGRRARRDGHGPDQWAVGVLPR